MEQGLQYLSWTLLGLPQQYFGEFQFLWERHRITADPLVLGILLATLLLVAGVIGGLFRRERALLWFLMPAALAHLAVGLAPLLHGVATSLTWAPVTLLGVEAALIVWALWRARASWPSIMIALFMVTYAFVAMLFSAMALTGNWL
jgi:hypothetical protein